MPVLVTAADDPLPSRVVLRLLQEGGEVRAYCTGARDGDPGALRRAGAMIATGDLDDEGHLEAAMEQAHTVVHLGGGVFSSSVEAIVEAARTVATAAAQAGVRRLILLSVAGAGRGSDDPLRRAKGESEAAVAAAGVPSVVLRTSLILTRRLRDALAFARPGGDPATVEVAPVRPEDLVELVVAFDALRSTADEGHVVFHAYGPRRMPLASLLDPPGGAVGRRFVGADEAPLLASALRGPWVEEVPDGFDAWAFAGIEPATVTAGGG